MSEPLPYSDVVKLESFLWEECMVLLPHPLDCAGWIYVIGLRDMALDEKTCDDLKMTDEVLGLEIDFWDEIPRVLRMSTLVLVTLGFNCLGLYRYRQGNINSAVGFVRFEYPLNFDKLRDFFNCAISQ